MPRTSLCEALLNVLSLPSGIDGDWAGIKQFQAKQSDWQIVRHCEARSDAAISIAVSNGADSQLSVQRELHVAGAGSLLVRGTPQQDKPTDADLNRLGQDCRRREPCRSAAARGGLRDVRRACGSGSAPVARPPPAVDLVEDSK